MGAVIGLVISLSVVITLVVATAIILSRRRQRRQTSGWRTCSDATAVTACSSTSERQMATQVPATEATLGKQSTGPLIDDQRFNSILVWNGGLLVDSAHFVRWVAGSNPALAAT